MFIQTGIFTTQRVNLNDASSAKSRATLSPQSTSQQDYTTPFTISIAAFQIRTLQHLELQSQSQDFPNHTTSHTMAEQTPRVNASILEQFTHRTVRILGKVTQLRGEEATIDAGGQINVHLNRVSSERSLDSTVILPQMGFAVSSPSFSAFTNGSISHHLFHRKCPRPSSRFL